MSGVFCLQEFKHIGHLWKSALHFSEANINSVSIFSRAPWGREKHCLISSLWEDRDRSTKSSVDQSIFSSDKSNFSLNFFAQTVLDKLPYETTLRWDESENTSIKMHFHHSSADSTNIGSFVSNMIITGDLESQSWLKNQRLKSNEQLCSLSCKYSPLKLWQM